MSGGSGYAKYLYSRSRTHVGHHHPTAEDVVAPVQPRQVVARRAREQPSMIAQPCASRFALDARPVDLGQALVGADRRRHSCGSRAHGSAARQQRALALTPHR